MTLACRVQEYQSRVMQAVCVSSTGPTVNPHTLRCVHKQFRLLHLRFVLRCYAYYALVVVPFSNALHSVSR